MLAELVVSNLWEIAEKLYEINVPKYTNIYRQNYNLEDKKLMSKCFAIFEKWIKKVHVIGFNSAKYDCNIMKVD